MQEKYDEFFFVDNRYFVSLQESMYTKPKIKLEYSHHRDKEVVLIKFDYDKGLIDEVKKLAGSRWSQTKRCRYIPADN